MQAGKRGIAMVSTVALLSHTPYILASPILPYAKLSNESGVGYHT